jgi:hypothetical protein
MLGLKISSTSSKPCPTCDVNLDEISDIVMNGGNFTARDPVLLKQLIDMNNGTGQVQNPTAKAIAIWKRSA